MIPLPDENKYMVRRYLMMTTFYRIVSFYFKIVFAVVYINTLTLLNYTFYMAGPIKIPTFIRSYNIKILTFIRSYNIKVLTFIRSYNMKILTFINRVNIKCYAILNINAMVNCNSGKDDVMLKARCNVMIDDSSWQLGILCEQGSLIAE